MPTLTQILQLLTILIGFIFFVYSFIRFFGGRRNTRVIILDTSICIVALLSILSLYAGKVDPKFTDALIQNNLLQFIGTVLAIFFSLAMVPVTNIVQNTSSAFVGQVVRNEVFLKSIVLFFLIFVSVSAQSLLGVGYVSSIVHFVFLLIALISFLFITYETFRLMDVKNVIGDFEKEALFSLEKRWKGISSKNIELEKQYREVMLIKNALISETRTKIEPIFITTKRYVVLDHYDVVEKGLISIVTIAERYVDLFSFSIQDNDGLILYLIERIKDLKGTITDTTHYSTSSRLVFAIKELAKKSLDIKTPMSEHNRSYLPLGLITFLKEFVISKDILRETSSAPMDSISALEEIGLVAIQKDNFNMAKSCLDQLTEISVECTKLNFFFSNQLSKEASSSIIRLHYSLLKSMGGAYRILPFLSESIERPMKTFIEVGNDNAMKDNVSAFVGSGVDMLGITDPYSLRLITTLSYVVFFLVSRTEVDEKLLTDYLDEIFRDINQLLMESDRKQMFYLSSQIVDTAYNLAFTLLQFIEQGQIKNKELVRRFICERLYYIFSNSIYGCLTKDKSLLDEKLNKWLSTLGLYLVTFQTWDNFPVKTIDSLIERANFLIPLVQEDHNGEVYINHDIENDLSDIFRYLNLALYWEITLVGDESIKSNLLKFLIKNQSIVRMDFSSSKLPNPISSLGGPWSLEQPEVAYIQQYLWNSRILLDVTPSGNSQYNKFISKYEFYWKIMELINFKVGKSHTYELFHFRRDSSWF